MGYICFPHDFPVARHFGVSAAFELNLPVSLRFAGRFFSDTQHCGHVFSEMQPYDPATAEQEAIALVEMIRQYWMDRAAAIEAESQNTASEEEASEDDSSGIFNGFVLLNSPECDLEQIKANLLQDWSIACPPPEEEGQDAAKEKDRTLVFDVDGFMLAVSFVDAPVPDGEAEYFAQANYLWKDAVEVTKTHVAQIILAVFTRSGSPLDSAKLYTKLAASCLKLPNAVGIYTSGTVFQYRFSARALSGIREPYEIR